MLSVAELFLKSLDAITNDFEPEDFAAATTKGNDDHPINKLPSGTLSKVVTFAHRSIILIGTPLGTVRLEQAYPKDSSRLRIVSTKEFHALYPNPLDNYLTMEDMVHYLGDPDQHFGPNIGYRLAEAMGAMLHRSGLMGHLQPLTVVK